jgi:membrane-bound lytic murein transglycosylase B
LGDGFDSELLARLYTDPRTEYLDGAVATNLKRIERPADYSHFLSRRSVREGFEFLKRYRPILETVESLYGVPVETLVAILYVESRFGSSTGRYRVFNVYSSLAVAEEPAHVATALNQLRARYPGTTKAEIQRRANKKSTWAYEELKALLRIAYERGLDVHELKGSWAGAFGMPQFIPSSFLAYAVDGDRDGLVDLNSLTDAAASVGSYLKRHGWRQGLSRKQKAKVLRTYNNSSLYANTILAYADRLRQR